MAKNKLVDSIFNSNENEPTVSVRSPDVKKYMYKPLGLKNGKMIYGKINYVESIFKEKKEFGWLDTDPENIIE